VSSPDAVSASSLAAVAVSGSDSVSVDVSSVAAALVRAARRGFGVAVDSA
jgi:hypothetical protein